MNSVEWSDEDRCYVATNSDHPGLSGLGDNRIEAIEELALAIELERAELEET